MPAGERGRMNQLTSGPRGRIEPPRRGPAPAAHHLSNEPADDPTWSRPALIGLLLATAVLYMWGAGRASGWANPCNR
jgi:hypothetical protein